MNSQIGVPVWVRATLCLLAGISVPGVILAEIFGGHVPPAAAIAIVSLAGVALRLAFSHSPNEALGRSADDSKLLRVRDATRRPSGT